LRSNSLLPALALAFVPMVGFAQSNVRDFGAKGDGRTDDTAAFQRALNERGQQGGGIVSVPPGKYLIATHLAIPTGVTLEGGWRAPATVQQYHDPADPKGGPALDGSVLLATEGAGNAAGTPFITLHTNSCLKGVTVFYPNQTKTNPPVAYPWTVAAPGTDNPSIVDVLMVNPYQAVDFSNTAGRHYIRGLYAQALYRGLVVDICLDIGRLEDIHFWPFWTAADSNSPAQEFTLKQGIAFTFARADWEYVTNCFCIGYHMGYRFVKSTHPTLGAPANVLLTQSGADLSEIAVQVDDSQAHAGISFSNAQIFGDVIVAPTNSGMVRFTGCGLFGSLDGARGTALAKLAGRGRVSFDNCHFYCIDPKDKGAATILVEGGRLSVNGCVFINSRNTAGVNCNPVPIVLEPDVISAVITGNEFYGAANIRNRARGRVVIANNVEQTDEDPYLAKSAPGK